MKLLTNEKKKSLFLALVAWVVISIWVSGCLNTTQRSIATTPNSTSNGGLTTGSDESAETACKIFSNNSNDFLICKGCAESLGSTELNLLVACVHNNITSTGGTCIGLKCGDGQYADFASCSCKDASSPTDAGPTPGQEDTESPVMTAGFYIGNRFCSIPTNTSAEARKYDCLDRSGGTTATLPKYTTQAPANVFQDIGYIRWDLALDASQYPPALPLANNRPFLGTNSTLIANLNVFFQLKPNTKLASGNTSSLSFTDCAEHFSGYHTSATSISLSSKSACDARSYGSNRFPTAIPITFSTTGGNGYAQFDRVSLNGGAANFNVTRLYEAGNPNAQNGGLDQMTTVGRQGHTAVWTGSQMIIWGGRLSSGGSYIYYNDGFKYNPAANTWALIAPTKITKKYDRTLSTPAWVSVDEKSLAGRVGHSAVYNGAFGPAAIQNKMIIWGGKGPGCTDNSNNGYCEDGAIYDFAGDSWADVSTASAPPTARAYHSSVLDTANQQLVVWGGENTSGYLSDGGILDENGWTLISSGLPNTPSARAYASTVFVTTGADINKMIVWGGYNGSSALADGGLYEPGTNTWAAISSALLNTPTARYLHTAVWDNTNDQMIIWGGYSGSATLADGATYNGAWTATGSGGVGDPAARIFHTAIWIPAGGGADLANRMMIWGGCSSGGLTGCSGNSFLNTGGLYDPTLGGTWTATNTADAATPTARAYHTAVFDTANNQVHIWGGEGSGGDANPIGGNITTPLVPTGNGTWTSDIGTGYTPAQGFLANLGYYKYSWGPLAVSRPQESTDLASSSASGTIAINTNLGYTPASAVDSTSFSPEAMTGNLTTRDCSSSTSTCVVTAVYRGSGGSVLYQSFAPRFANHTSTVGALPTGVNAVSTPKVIEDTSQLSTADTTKPARLRVFVRGADGNIYMNKGERGFWSNWVNLGKPWVMDSATASDPYSSLTNSVYKPFTNTVAAASGLTGTYATPYSNSSTFTNNDGISIAGEPVVASFMSTSTTSTNIKGYIAIFVRVSQIRSTDGSTGPYHNAVFYTFATAGGTGSTAATLATTLDFDKVSNWSRWMPVVRVAGGATEAFHVQGNPLAIMNNKVDTDANAATEDVVVYLLGTRALGTLHAPIAPDNGLNVHPDSLSAFSPWYNYQNTVIRTSLELTGFGMNTLSPNTTTNTCVIAPGCAAPGGITWNGTGDSFSNHSEAVGSKGLNADEVFVSDWTYSNLQDIKTNSTVDGIRIYASKLTTAQLKTTSGKSPAIYRRKIQYYEYKFVTTGTEASGLQAINGASNGCQLTTNIQFWGNATPVTITSSNATFADPITQNRTLLFGRGLCPFKNDPKDPANADSDKLTCDTVNPSAAYAALSDSSVSGCAADTSATMYYTSDAVKSDNKANSETSTAQRKLLPQLVTSDVIAIYSSALKNANNDVPVYLIFRNPDGILSHGYWGSSQNGTGPQFFSFLSRGGFTN